MRANRVKMTGCGTKSVHSFHLSLWLTLSTSFLGCAGITTRSSENPEIQSDRSFSSIHVEESASFHYSMAQLYSLEGDSDRSIEEYKLALFYDPKSPHILTRLSSEYLKKNQLDLAMETAKKATELDPKNIDARVTLAGLLRMVKQNDESFVHLKAALVADPENEEVLGQAVQVALENENPTQALQLIDAFLKKVPDSSQGYYYRGRVYHQQERFKLAEKSYLKSIDFSLNQPQAYLALGYLYEENNQWEKAVKFYQEGFDLTQDVGLSQRLAALLLQKEKTAEAVQYLEAVDIYDPEDINNLIKLGLVYFELKRFKDAEFTFLKILKNHPDSDRIIYYLGNVYESMDKKDEAIAQYRKITSNYKFYPEASIQIAALFRDKGLFKEAQERLEVALVTAPRLLKGYLFLAMVYEDQKNLVGAISALDRARKYYPDDTKVLYFLGRYYQETKDFKRSAETMETLISLEPKNVQALNFLGYLYTEQGEKMDRAEKFLKRAAGLEPKNGYVLDSLGWYWFKKGDYAQAIRCLEKAANLLPNEAVVLEHLADAYHGAELPNRAIAAYSKAMDQSVDPEQKMLLMSKKEKAEHSERSAPSRMPASLPNR